MNALYEGAPGFDRYMPYEAVKSAHTFYRAGLSVGEIAALVYRRYGYANVRSCEGSLLRAWKTHGFPVRSNVEAQRLRSRRSACAGCGCPHDERTRGCHCCNRRHYERALTGIPYIASSRADTCGRCGCPHRERTYGCVGCMSRHASWKRRGLPYLAGNGPQTCSGCGVQFAERSVGCAQCTSRHWRRSKRGPASSPRADSRDGGAALSRKIAA